MARYVTVSSVSLRSAIPYEKMEERLAESRMYAMRASRMGADIVSYPEIFIQMGGDKSSWAVLAEPIDGRSTAYMADVARELGMYIVWPLFTRESDRVYNSSVLLDRQGKVAGVYHKMFPTIGEIENGVTPGEEIPVFETDFGRIGLCICFDLNFRPIVQGLADNGAEVIFFSSMYRGGLQLRMWAHELRRYFVSAIGAELGQVVDMSGEVLAEATYEALAVKRINLDRRFLHMDGNWDKMDEMLAKYGTGITFQYYTREGKYTIASELPDKSIGDVIAEFSLEEQVPYFSRAMRVREEALQKLKRE
ncbi:MAG: carbon-nitrogen hydrolase family protein [Anaerolineae bacterium]